MTTEPHVGVIPDQEPGWIESWVSHTLGSSPAQKLFSTHHLSRVLGYRLADGREVVVKARPGVQRAARCVTAQFALHGVGFPCPEPLTAVEEVEGLAVHAEAYVPEGERYLDIEARTVDRFAALLAELTSRLQLINPAPPDPPPPWLGWDHSEGDTWPNASGDGAHTVSVDIPRWLTALADRVRRRLEAASLPAVVSHGDWETQHLQWRNGAIWVVHDWDSLASRPEAALVGAAAATFASDRQPILAPVASSERFLETYQRERVKRFTDQEVEVAWAAGLWLAAHNARMELIHDKPLLVLDALVEQATERSTRAGT